MSRCFGLKTWHFTHRGALLIILWPRWQSQGLCSVPLRPLFWVLINSSVSSVGIFVHEDRKGRWICINLLQYIQCLIYYEGFAVLPAYPYTLSLPHSVQQIFASDHWLHRLYQPPSPFLQEIEAVYLSQEILWFRWERSCSLQSSERKIQERK